MRYLYGASDEKFVKAKSEHIKNNEGTLSSYKFRLRSITAGKSLDFDKQSVPLVFKCTPEKLLHLCIKEVDGLPLPSILEWNIENICKWLRGMGFPQYQNTFRENLINGRTLMLLDTASLVAMNIKDFEHCKKIAYAIRMLFYLEMTRFGRSISFYPEFHYDVYKLFRVKTGFSYDETRRSDLWRKLQMIREKDPNNSHWEQLEEWLDITSRRNFPERFGNIHRFNMYRCKPKAKSQTSQAKQIHRCHCLPPCECYWTDDERREPWKLKCLAHLKPDREFVLKCDGCIPPCTCRWTSKKYMTRSVLTCLQQAFPQKYGPVNSSAWQRTKKREELHSYRLSLM